MCQGGRLERISYKLSESESKGAEIPYVPAFGEPRSGPCIGVLGPPGVGVLVATPSPDLTCQGESGK